ncbi:MAG: RNA polymerase-binding protein DksA [Thiotrichales bacterium]|nr:MAG: RNA polymerase-binding protein DksA [Thiotrichales bacterium]
MQGSDSFKEYNMGKNEEYMNEKQLVHFKDILEQIKKELQEENKRTVEILKSDHKDKPSEDVDRATQEEEFRLRLRESNRGMKLLNKINKSLRDIRDSEYGYCESCGSDIGIKRLEARPTATLCIDCKTVHEIKEKQYN